MSTAGRIPGFLWTTNPKNGGADYAAPSYYPYKPIITLHMTVSMSLSQSYIQGHSVPPHLWANPYNLERYQTVEVDRAGYALYQPQYGYHWVNKHAYNLQTELVGVPVVNVRTYTDAHCKWIGENVIAPQAKWLLDHALPIDLSQVRYHQNSSGSASDTWPGRMSEQECADFNGVMAHIDWWANDHWDCSVEDTMLMVHYAILFLESQTHPIPVGEGMKYSVTDETGTLIIVDGFKGLIQGGYGWNTIHAAIGDQNEYPHLKLPGGGNRVIDRASLATALRIENPGIV